MTPPLHVLVRAAGALTLAGAAVLAHAGMLNVPCSAPFVFRGAAVNVMVMPFTMPDKRSAAADLLAQLVQRETLRSIAKFSSVASVQLRQTGSPSCEPEEVRAKVLGERGGARATVEPGRGVVMVWGRIVESGDTLYSQVFVDFFRRGGVERLELPLADGRLVGPLSAQGFAGPHRRIDRAVLAKINDFAARNNVVYESADEKSAKTTIPLDVPFYYYVTEIRGDWMRIATFTPDNAPPSQIQPGQSVFGKRQWMRAVAAEPDWTLRKVLPEMAFVEGAVGYLVLRDVRSASLAPAARTAMLAATTRALDEWQQNLRRNVLERELEVFDERYAVAASVASEMQGVLRLSAPERSAADLRLAREKFAASSRLQPGNPDARNLALMSDLALAARSGEEAEPPLRAAEALLATLGIAPGNASVQANLRLTYRWLLGQAGARPAAWKPLSGEDRARLAATLGTLDEAALPR